jgi:hypothetical protein
MLSVGTAAFNCRAKLVETLPALAVSVTACALPTGETVAVNEALVAFAGTVTVVGTATAALLLDKLTHSPPPGAAAFSVTVQASVPAPVIDPLPHDTALNAAAPTDPVPLRLIASEVPLRPLLLLVIVNCPVAAPATAGSKTTLNVTAWPGFSVTGKLAPDTEKPAPVSVAALMVKAKLPVEFKVRDCVDDELTSTLPKTTLVALMLRIRVAASNCRTKLLETLPALAVSVTACAV